MFAKLSAGLFALGLMAAAPGASAGCLPQGGVHIETAPLCPLETDSTVLSVAGWFPDLCWGIPVLDSSHVADSVVTLYTSVFHGNFLDPSDSALACWTMVVDFALDCPLGRLAAGRRRVDLIVDIDSRWYGGVYVCSSTFDVLDTLGYDRGDASLDRRINAVDIVRLVNHVFKNGREPCANTGDVDCDGESTSADVIGLVAYVFKSGKPPCSP